MPSPKHRIDGCITIVVQKDPFMLLNDYLVTRNV